MTTLNTPAALDALPEDSVVLDPDKGAHQAYQDTRGGLRWRGPWDGDMDDSLTATQMFRDHHGPFTLLVPAPAPDREALYADAVNLAAARSPFGHPLPSAEIRAAQAGVDAVLDRPTASPTDPEPSPTGHQNPPQ